MANDAAERIDCLVRRYLPMAVRMARRCVGRGVDRDDLESEAQLALLSAARRACQDGVEIRDFQAYAALWISGELRQLVRDAPYCHVARVPERIRVAAEKCRKAGECLFARGIRRPNIEQIAGEALLSVATVRMVMEIPGIVARQSEIEWADSRGGLVARNPVAALTPMFGPQPGFSPDTDCESIHRRPIARDSTLVCMVCHQSGIDHYPAMKRSRDTDPRPERPVVPAPEDPPPLASRRETRASRRQRLFAPSST